MKIRVTEIEANTEDLRSSQTLGSAFSTVLRNAFVKVNEHPESPTDEYDVEESEEE